MPHATATFIKAKLTHVHSHQPANDAMSLLQAVEDHLGSIDTWPSSIIQYLFVYTATQRVVELTAFFIGKGVPETLAYRLYHACNPTTNELVRQLFYTRYSIWQTSKTVRRMSIYYDVRMHKHVRLHVPYSTQLLALREIAVPINDLPAPALGIHNTATPKLVTTMLERVRLEQL